jgi:OFA family oxalate/formate antiporter-like MFS transporter
MVAIGHCQYTWTLFVPAYAQALRVGEASVQLGFSCFVALQTGSVLAFGLLAPSAGHEHSAMLGGAIVLLGALHGLAAARDIMSLYAFAALMGVGVGSVYSVCAAVSVRASVRHRGLAAGIVAAGYGAGSLPTMALIESSIASGGEGGAAPTLRALGWGIALTVSIAAALMPRRAAPRPSLATAAGGRAGAMGTAPREYTLAQAACEPSFYLLCALPLRQPTRIEPARIEPACTPTARVALPLCQCPRAPRLRSGTS